MSCDIAVAGALYLAALSPSMGQTPLTQPFARDFWVQASATAVNPLSREPLYAEIVRRANSLKRVVQSLKPQDAQAADQLKTPVEALAALDMKAHFDLAARGTDGDLKCILKGIAQDLPVKLNRLAAATDPTLRQSILSEMSFLLRDNVEVITSPPQPAA